MQLISADGKVKLVVKENKLFDEWVVRHFDLVNGNWVYSEDKTGYGDDLTDAMDTMNFSMRRYENANYKNIRR